MTSSEIAKKLIKLLESGEDFTKYHKTLTKTVLENLVLENELFDNLRKINKGVIHD